MALAPSERALLAEESDRLSSPLSEDQLDQLGRYVDQLELWSRRVNLIAAQDRSEILERHVLDSLAVVPLVRASATSPRVVDIGSGAGLPGFPLAIALPNAKLTLLEPRRKRANFLRSACRECFTWNIRIETLRAEEFAPPDEQRFDVAVSRATIPPGQLPALALHLVSPAGRLIGFTTDRTPASTQGHPGFEQPEVSHYQRTREGDTFTLTSWTRL